MRFLEFTCARHITQTVGKIMCINKGKEAD